MFSDVRMATTQVVCSIREETEFNGNGPVMRQALNLPQLTRIILDGGLQEESDCLVKSGGKRTAPDISGPNKRAKTDVSPSQSALDKAEMKLPAYAHKFELGYTISRKDGEPGVGNIQRRYADDQRAYDLGWLQEEENLIDALMRRNFTNAHHFELGNVTLEDHGGDLQVYLGCVSQHDRDKHYDLQYFAALPACTFPAHLQGDGPGNIFETCSSLLRSGHISMSASASLLYIPGIVSPELPIRLHVTIYVSLVIPAIFSPSTSHVPPTFSVEGQRRKFLSYLFCHDHVNSNGGFRREESKDGPINLGQFYSILIPAPSITSSIIYDALQPPGLRAALLPYQKRTVKWLLEREQKTIDSYGRIAPHNEDSESLPLFWQRVDVASNAATVTDESSSRPTWYYNPVTGSLSEALPPSDNIAGAMLCEEMGLGKTLECIALILLNPASDRTPVTTAWDAGMELYVSPVKTNLIVTPPTLSQQWLDELARHAPGLKVLSYVGYNKIRFPRGMQVNKQDGNAAQPTTHNLWCSYIQGFDVVITTYNVLSQELGVAKAPVVRPKRQVASYSHVMKPRSPLVRVEWARVFMDEVQLVGGGKAAEMVSLIPRKVSVAVSGTPAKSKVSDLSHVLRFLRIEKAVGSTRTWDSLLKQEFGDSLIELFQKYAVRTLKTRVQNELTIPLQTRFVVGIEFGKAERHIYDLTLQEALDELGVDNRGVAAYQGWQLDTGLLRSWLRRLRQICTHPQVGTVKATMGSIRTKTIKTIEEVLQRYQEQNWNSLIAEVKNKIYHRIRQAQLVQALDDDMNRYQRARDLLLRTQPDVEQLLNEVRVAIAEHEERGKILIEEAAARRRERNQSDTKHDSQVIQPKGKRKLQDIDSSDEENSDSDGLPKTQRGDEHRNRQRALQGRLREVYVLQHKVFFLLGDVYHVLGASIQEESSYADAETVRTTLLKSSEEAAISAMAKLALESEISLKELQLSLCQKGGIRSAHLMEEANEILALLNEQGDLLWQWRAHIFGLLTQKLTSTEKDQPDGGEYARALDTQGEAEAYLEAYAALIADRKEVLIAERTVLATHDVREIRVRDTMAARKAMGSTDLDFGLDLGLENDILQHELAEQRKILKEDRSKRALKAVMFELTEISNRAGDRPEEVYIAKCEGKRLRNVIADQGLVMEKFESELTSFRKAFNERIQYFRQLQELSDSVVQPECEDVPAAIRFSITEEEKATLRANAKRAEQRHFLSLAKDRAEGELEAEDCVLCGELFQCGLMTPCGHIFCEGCLTRWIKHRRKQTYSDCPMCRSNIEIDALQRISLNDIEYEKQQSKRGVSRSLLAGLAKFSTLPQSTLDDIQTFEAHGSYGSKITHLVRHLLYIQNQEPGTKSVVFSAWSDSLTIIQKALLDNGIGSIRADQKGKRDAAQLFKSDPDLVVFLLHGERENAGLNLTCAKRVWLIEPTVNHAFEVQAISRVDRMGQTSATEVFCYYIQDTVEENILRMGARSGLSLYTQDHSRDTIDISEFSMGMQKAPVDSPSKKEKQKGDFIAKQEDLVHVLFPHLDFQEEDVLDLKDVEPVNERVHTVTDSSTLAQGTNAIAGPSRLR